MRKTMKWSVLALACGVALSTGLAISQMKADASTDGYTAKITSSMQGETLTLLSNQDFIDFASNYTVGSAINYTPAVGVDKSDRYLPKPATITWEDSRDDALYYTLYVGLEKDLSDAESYVVSKPSADVDYLFGAKHYYYQVYAHYENDEVVKSRVFDFYTADLPRTIYVEGVTNTRDIGGRFTEDGQYQIKQGMVYRGSEVNRSLGAITEEGKRVMVHDLGIKTDLDLRGGDVQNPTSTSPIGDSLNYIHVEAPWYTHIKNESYKEALATEFRTFANPDNYPIFLHCSVGRDRAGTLSFMLSALLGMKEADFYRDYEITFFSRVGSIDATQAQGQFMELMGYAQDTIEYIKEAYPADTLMDSMERYVTEYLGLTKAEVDSIRNILWEDASYSVMESNTAKRSSPARLNASKSATATAETSEFSCSYSVSSKGEAGSLYGSSAVNTYTATEAATKGIPEGYENNVLEVVPIGSSANCGIMLDFTAQKIPVSIIESFQFRVYIGVADKNANTNYPQIRITDPNGSGSWVFQENKPNVTGKWVTVTIPYKSSFSYLTQADGSLGKFELSLRSQGVVPFYIDSFACVLKANDGVAPVITYTGSNPLVVALGKGLGISPTANDTQQGAVPVEYVWENGVTLNANGAPDKVGSYNLTLKAVDYYGNTATQNITVNVVEEDKILPVITCSTSVVKAQAGTKPMITFSATDNSGNCSVTTTWSDGALDMRNRLTVGEHTWTITATDVFDNATTKVINFIVTDNEPTYSSVTDEKATYGNVTVTFDGTCAIWVPYGTKIDKPFDPVKAPDEAISYEFDAWCVGDTEWIFNENVATSDVNLVSRWIEHRQLYTVTFDGKNAQKVEFGRLIPIPEIPQKTPTSKTEFVFDGWYLGDTKWDFEKDVITGDLNLTAKFTETARRFNVTFDGANEQVYEYGSKITKPADPEKAPTATTRYEFIGWFFGSKEWNFETDIVNYHINLQSKWKEIAIEVTPDDDSQSSSTQPGGDVDSSVDGETPEKDSSSAGCGGVISGMASGMLALGVATVTLLKKKEN